MSKSNPDPVVGEMWRERRKAYAKRTVRVTRIEGGFVFVQTITNDKGKTVQQPRTPTRVRLSIWHNSWVPA